MTPSPPGTVGWIDLTVDDATSLSEFYGAAVGWKPEPVSLGDYNDFNMCDAESGEARAGVCHRRGGNADVPAGWMVYFMVEDLDASIREVEQRGGKILVGPRTGGGRHVVIEDPAGAVCALFEAEK